MTSLTMKTVNNVLREATKKKTRGKKSRELSNDEVRQRCNKIIDFCTKSKEEGGYACHVSKGQMIAKVTAILNTLATGEALACNKEMDKIVKTQTT